jgi:glycerol-3-phosphate dehydrogenase
MLRSNGVEISLNTVVTGFEMQQNKIQQVQTNRGNFTAKTVINAAGLWSDKIAEFADDRFFSIHGRKGVDAILDLKTGQFQKTIAAMPPLIQAHSKTKGGGLVITPEGNILVGPNAEEVPYRENYKTDSRGS